MNHKLDRTLKAIAITEKSLAVLADCCIALKVAIMAQQRIIEALLKEDKGKKGKNGNGHVPDLD